MTGTGECAKMKAHLKNEIIVLEHLKFYGPLCVKDLTRMLGIERVDIARAVWAMCDKGIVNVGPDWKVRIVEGK